MDRAVLLSDRITHITEKRLSLSQVIKYKISSLAVLGEESRHVEILLNLSGG